METPKMTLTLVEQVALAGQLIRDGVIPQMPTWEAAATVSKMFNEAQDRIIADGFNPVRLLEAMSAEVYEPMGGGGELFQKGDESTEF